MPMPVRRGRTAPGREPINFGDPDAGCLLSWSDGLIVGCWHPADERESAAQLALANLRAAELNQSRGDDVDGEYRGEAHSSPAPSPFLSLFRTRS